ncbi:MAG: hypothetical protein EXS15_02845 [Phycisphaerales bacterium]|nr:hypothetical protein [Phycisphaerales bacterium]
MSKKFFVGAMLLSLGASAFDAHADMMAPVFSYSISSGGLTVNGSASDFGSVRQLAPTEWFFQGNTNALAGTSLSWAYLVDPDPFITGTFSVTNETASAREYVINFSLPISPSIEASTMSGQVAGTLTDANGSGSALLTSIAGGNVYTALADELFVYSLMSGANHWVSNPFGTTSFSGGSFGQGTTLAGPLVNDTIGIRFAFTLSAGDSASFSSIFVVNPVPAPGVFALAVVTGLIGYGRRRRSS